MFGYIWPLALILLSNTVYQICAKSVPEGMDTFASLTVTYFVSTVFSLIMYYILQKDANIAREYARINWAPFILGIVIVGLEAGYIFAFKAGWPVSLAQTVQGVLLAVILIFVGWRLYGEPVTWNKIAGVGICLAGLYLINMK